MLSANFLHTAPGRRARRARRSTFHNLLGASIVWENFVALNPDVFANGDPANLSDPFGLMACCSPEEQREIAQGVVKRTEGLVKLEPVMLAVASLPTLGVGDAALGSAGGAAETTNALTRARALGKAGEEAAGIVKNTQRIPSLTGTAKYRIPDALNTTTLTEVKNVAKLSVTNQLRDFAAYAAQEKLKFELFVRETTELTKTLAQFIKDNSIVVRTFK